MDISDARELRDLEEKKANAKTKSEKAKVKEELTAFYARHSDNTLRLTKELERLTRLESRLTILGYVQRGGTPSALDRILATRLGTACAELIHEGHFGVMVAARGDGIEPVPIEEVAGKRKLVPADHPWVQSARHVGTSFGD